MKRNLWITKYNPDTGDYGLYNRDDRAITWVGDETRTKSAAARLNAPDHVYAHIQGAIDQINVALSSALDPETRAAFLAARRTLRGMIGFNPTMPPAIAISEAVGQEHSPYE